MQVLHHLPKGIDANMLVGLEYADDAAVYRLSDDMAVVQSVDFFTPVVDDPYIFGKITAANALSDIYAMGATPIFALNIVAFPSKDLPPKVLEDILTGGAHVAAEAGIVIAGGHSIDDKEPKYGMSVTGKVHPDKIVKNSTARAGDRLILTKPLGSGIITSAIKKGCASEAIMEEAINWMVMLNKDAAEAMVETGVSAVTDITGFGLLGHLYELVDASGVAAVLKASDIPLMNGVEECLAAGAYSGGSKGNMDFVADHVDWDDNISEDTKKIFCDAQTSGGLLICVPEDKTKKLISELEKRNVFHVDIGHLCAEDAGRIRLEP